MRKNVFTSLLVLLFFTSTLNAQTDPAPVTAKEKGEVIDSICAQLNNNYVFPEVAKEMADLLHKKLKEKQYDALSDPRQFATTLTTDLQSISKDKHLRVNFNPQQVEEMRAFAERQEENEDEEIPEAWLKSMARNNFGFKEVKILDGNIGYLDLRGFNDPAYAGPTAVAAMNYLSNADALIIDLRQNGGGSPGMIQLITSYLYGPEPVHLNNFYWRPSDEHTQTWTLPYVEGKRRPDRDVYVLTSGRTFSAAEEFSYNLRNLERATLVGETTGGGAHPGGSVVASDRFLVWVPQGRAINPITKTNWEGTGVEPHVKVPAPEALDKAHVLAMEKLMEKAVNEEDKAYFEWHLPSLKAKFNPVKIETEVLKKYVGDYGDREIKMKEGKLYYNRKGNPENELKPLAEDLFFFEEAPYFRLKIEEKDGEVVGLRGLYENGHTDYSAKTKAKP